MIARSIPIMLAQYTMHRPPVGRIRLAALFVGALFVVGGCAEHCAQITTHASEPNPPPGRVVLFTGVGNLVSNLHGLRGLIEEAHPHWEVDLRAWGPMLRGIGNLEAYERNRATARARADELAAYRRAHPDARITVVGYSGGGGMAVFTVEALPDDVHIDRLILIAPAISPDYPLDELIFPKVKELVVNFASKRDLQVGWGTKTFGTMDRVKTYSAGYSGFTTRHRKLVQIHWSEAMQTTGHAGNHLGYLVPAWQQRYLMPFVEPGAGEHESEPRP
jgi:pimeloyl-ACP methyl ester carboxylesterase